MKKNIGVVGCGIVGLLVSYKFSQLGHKVTIFEKDNGLNFSNCSVTAAGMISPYCELIHSNKKIFELGETSLLKWKKIIKELNSRIFFKSKGSLVVTQIAEKSDLELICERVNSHTKSKLKILTNKQIQKLEPDIDSINLTGLLFKDEGQVDCLEIMNALIKFLKLNGSLIKFESHVEEIKKNTVSLKGGERINFDHVIECTGLDSIGEKGKLRGVRGEIIKVFAENVNITRPIRLHHFRYPTYITPRGKNNYLIGATEIESKDSSPVSVRSALELLSSSMLISKSFSEARILELSTNCRPAYIDNLPSINIKNDFISANGLYRHGYLLSPLIAELIADYCLNKKKDKKLSYIYN
ncbi:FAD-dependent oxidoreductase [bacterium]|jgi:glycine oxidase|nr:FAD-dependent oxidoreductase [bacterium]MBT4435787.1 FAD-dependent oxidoreductase [bacterium]